MNIIKQPNHIKFGLGVAKDFSFPKNSLVITSKGAISRGWLNYTNLESQAYFDNVEPNPSLDTAQNIISIFENQNIECIVGLGGGSSLDVAKFVGHKLNKKKILIPTTFGSGSEVTRIAVLNVNGKKTSFHDDRMFADVALVDPYFIKDAPFEIIKNSAIDACAQCTESFDSKLANIYTKFLCEKAFDILEKALINENYEDLSYGAMISGLGFGNSSTTLGHALSYVYSNEGISHGHALAFTTTIAHKFNDSKFYDRFKSLSDLLNFKPIKLNQNLEKAAELIQTDRKHLDYNPKNISNNEIIKLLSSINSLN
jgi:succinate semialdehyde reductase